jgi:probable blue pigment (indigoidine) exporter
MAQTRPARRADDGRIRPALPLSDLAVRRTAEPKGNH